MLEIRMVHGVLLKKVVDLIKDMVANVNFLCTPDSLSLHALDTSHVALVSYLLKSNAFEHYRCDRNVSIGVNLDNLSIMLRLASNEDIITIKLHEDDGSSDFVTLLFERPTRDKIVHCDMLLMDIDGEVYSIPEKRYDANIRMPSRLFAQICKDLSNVGTIVLISVTKEEGLKFSTSGGDVGKAEVLCKGTNSIDKPEESIIIEMNEPVSLPFSLRFLNSFTKANPLSNTVEISLSPNMPLLVEYKIAEMGYIKFHLASAFT